MPTKHYTVSRIQILAYDPDYARALSVLFFWWIGVLFATFAGGAWWTLFTGVAAIALYVWWTKGLREDYERLLSKGTIIEATVAALNYIPMRGYPNRYRSVIPEVVFTYEFDGVDHEVTLNPDPDWVREYVRYGKTVDLVINPKHPDVPAIVTTFAEMINTNKDKT